MLFAFRELLHTRTDELAAIITAEHGKVLSDAAGEIARGLENVEFATGVPQLLKGGFSEQAASGVDVYSIRQPLGVVAGITPFNFPVMVPLWMCANAIACGNAFVLKPSEKDPSAVAVPRRSCGRRPACPTASSPSSTATRRPSTRSSTTTTSRPSASSARPRSRSTSTSAARRNGKRVQALGGAKNHALVLPDADLDMAADAIVSAAYGAAGERCMALSVAVAVGDVGDDLVGADLRPAAQAHASAPAPTRTPTWARSSPASTATRSPATSTPGAEPGATVVVDGREADVPADGFFLGMTLLDHVTPDMTRLHRRDLRAGALGRARRTPTTRASPSSTRNPYANGTAIFTRDGGAARRFQIDVEVGMVGINVPIPVPVAYYSFGGWKDSLFGDTHMYGPEGINFYTRGKVVTRGGPTRPPRRVDLGFPRTR